MKRTLLEVICGAAACGLLASLHWQVSRLENQQRDVAELEHKVDLVAEATASMATRDPRDELAALRQLAAAHEERVRQLESQLKSAQDDALKAGAVAA
ncbi:MAG: hypothetical protein ACK6D1_04350 [Planctomycetota bacterium]